jgi:hypothetical protein
MTKFTIDVQKGELVVKGTGKAPGGNAKKRPLTDLKWQAAAGSGLRFDLAFESLVYADGLSDPAPAWPFGTVIGTDGVADPVQGTVTGASYFEAEIGAAVAGTFKYSVTAMLTIQAVVDPVIIVEP